VSRPEFRVLPTAADVAEAAADEFIAVAREAVQVRGRFLVALSGGRTPHAVYHLLRHPESQDLVPWDRVEIFWGDERAVPESDPASNAGEARRALLDQVPGLRPGAVHPMDGGAADLDDAARRYEEELRAASDTPPGQVPVLDLVWLGMGADGHTASLCPGSTALEETDRLVVAAWAPAFAAMRLTLTFPVLNAARQAAFLVTGADKAEALARVRSGDHDLPAARVAARRTTWLVDAAAAGGEA